MKKLLSLSVAVLLAGFANAQTSTTITTTTSPGIQKWRFGIKGNLGGSWLKSNRTEAAYKSAGFQVGGGLQLEKRISNTASFVTGIDISLHSGSLNFNDSSYVSLTKTANNTTTTYHMASAKYSVQSIDIPLCLKLKTNEINYITYWVQVGVIPSITWKANATNLTYHNFSGNGTSELTGNDETLNVREDVNLFRASVMGGLGIEYSLSGSTALLVGLNYVDGVTSTLSSQSDLLTTYSYKTKTHDPLKQAASSKYVNLTVGILF